MSLRRTSYSIPGTAVDYVLQETERGRPAVACTRMVEGDETEALVLIINAPGLVSFFDAWRAGLDRAPDEETKAKWSSLFIHMTDAVAGTIQS